jgi:hypothetical protein
MHKPKAVASAFTQHPAHCGAKPEKQGAPADPVVVQTSGPGASGQFIVPGHRLVVPSHVTSHWHELVQFTVPHADAAPAEPWHVTSQRSLPQLTVPHAALPPEQVSRQRPELHVRVPHAPVPEQVAVQSPELHEMLPHASAPVQVAVQSPELHEMLPHALAPAQSTLQSAFPQVMPRHASGVGQSMLHESAFVQVIVPHAPATGQVMLQFQPAGQVMLPPPVPWIVQVVVWKSHWSWQIAGHTAASAGRASAGSVPTTQ